MNSQSNLKNQMKLDKQTIDVMNGIIKGPLLWQQDYDKGI